MRKSVASCRFLAAQLAQERNDKGCRNVFEYCVRDHEQSSPAVSGFIFWTLSAVFFPVFVVKIVIKL